jgi:hypothetical protein
MHARDGWRPAVTCGGRPFEPVAPALSQAPDFRFVSSLRAGWHGRCVSEFARRELGPGEPGKEDAMTRDFASNELRSTRARAAALLIAAAALNVHSAGAGAHEPRRDGRQTMDVRASERAAAELERAFWFCDYAATVGSVDSGMAIACSTVTQELKAKKFGGDFDALVSWWRQNKAAEHGALEAAFRAAPRR